MKTRFMVPLLLILCLLLTPNAVPAHSAAPSAAGLPVSAGAEPEAAAAPAVLPVTVSAGAEPEAAAAPAMLPVTVSAGAEPEAAPQTAVTPPMQVDFGRMPLYFIENQGQLDAPVAYYIQGRDKALYFTPQGVTFALAPQKKGAAGFLARLWQGLARWNIRLDFVGANAVTPIGREKTEAIVSYFKGPPEQWHTGLPTYAQIVYPNLWEGIDLVYRGTVNRPKYEFFVAPGADPTQIRLAYRGASVRLDEAGRLHVQTPVGEFYDDIPVAYQEVDGQRVPVAVAYALADDVTLGAGEPRSYGFRLGAYDLTRPLVIDPTHVMDCTYLGGGEYDLVADIAAHGVGLIWFYVVGTTYSTEATFPTVVGPDPTYNGNGDAFVAKLDISLNLVYLGYIGGNKWDSGNSIAVDANGAAYIVGNTISDEQFSYFPVLVGPDLTHNSFNNSESDAFVAKVNPEGTGLEYCGYIGGNSEDLGYAIAVDQSGSAYVTGGTRSTEGFPVLIGPDLVYHGGEDAYVAKVRPDGTGLVYCGYLGSDSMEEGFGIAVDEGNYAYITGRVWGGSDFPTLVGPDLTPNGSWDAFVTQVRNDGTGLVYSGFIGGSQAEYGLAIAVDGAGNAYVTGLTHSWDFPVQGGPDLSWNGEVDAFVAKVSWGGTGLEYCGYIGGASDDEGHDIAVDDSDNAYVVGWTLSSEESFPVVDGPDLTYNGMGDAFVAKVRASGAVLEYCGYIGGSDSDSAWAIALTRGIYIPYVVGYTYSDESTFPDGGGIDLSMPGFDQTYNGNGDGFLTSIAPGVRVTFGASSPYIMDRDEVLFYATVDDFGLVHGSREITMTLGEDPFVWTLYDEEEFDDICPDDGVHNMWLPTMGEGPQVARLYYEGSEVATMTITITQHPHLVVVTDIKALYDQFRATGMEDGADDDRDGMPDFYQLLNRLYRYAADHKGIVYDVRANINPSHDFPVNYAWLTFADDDPATNRIRMAQLIDEALTRLHHDSQHTIANVALVGSDEVVPYYRLNDPADPDIEYPEGTDNPTALDLEAGYLVSDLPYGTVDYVNQEAVLRPTPQVAVGRVAAARPLSLIDRIDMYEGPLLLGRGGTRIALLVLSGNEEQYAWVWTAENVWEPVLWEGPLRENTEPPFYGGFYEYRGDQIAWGPSHVLNVMDFAELVVLATRGGCLCTRTMLADDVCGPDYVRIGIQAINVIETSFSGLQHAYYSPSGNHRYFEESIALAMQDSYITYLGNSGVAYRFPKVVGVTDYLMSHFAEQVLNGANKTVGEAYVHAWDGYWASGGAKSKKARSASYAMILWGLPTQGIARGGGGVAAVVTPQAEPAAAPASLARTLTVAVDVPQFRFDYDAAGTALVTPGNGGGAYAPDAGWPLVPQVMHRYILPAGATDVQVVENTAARVTQAAGAVPLRVAQMTANCAEECRPPDIVPPVVLTTTYPASSFEVDIRPTSDTTSLALSVVPAQYTPGGQLTLFTHMEFTVSYNLPAAPAAAITGLTVNGGLPVRSGAAAVPLAVDVTSDVARAVTLTYSLEGPNGYTLDKGVAEVVLPAGASQVSLTLDAARWTPGANLLIVQLGDDSGTLDTAFAPVQVLGLRLAVEPATQSVLPGDGLPLTVRAWDEDGVPVGGLAAAIAVKLDGSGITLPWVEGPVGTYRATLDTAGLALGRHKLVLSAADGRGLQAEARVGFTVAHKIYLPLMMRRG